MYFANSRFCLRNLLLTIYHQHIAMQVSTKNNLRASTDSTGTGTSFKRAIRGQMIRVYIDAEQCRYLLAAGIRTAVESRSWLLVVSVQIN
jgi:hypothetical protein